jgi:hypothetical protein
MKPEQFMSVDSLNIPRKGSNAHLASFVLCNFMLGVLLAALTLAVGATSLGNVDLCITVF